MGTIKEWAKKHQDAIIIGSIVGAIAGIAILAATSSTNNHSTTPVIYTPEKPPKFGPGVITKYDDIDEAIFTDLAPEIENHVLDVNESGKITFERIYDITEPYFDGAFGGQFSGGELGDLFAHKVVTVTIEDVVGD